jgi:3-phenylpropionate/cinnamic acid dioxygenase small subunit
MSANAYEQIRNLLGTYTETMDGGRFADLAELFRDATMVSESGDVIADGYDAVRQNYERGTQLYNGSPRTKHVTTNVIIDVDEDAGTATARSAYVVFQGTETLPLQPIITGRYRDSFVRGDAGQWQFRQRMFFVDQIGDLSHHLTYTVTE